MTINLIADEAANTGTAEGSLNVPEDTTSEAPTTEAVASKALDVSWKTYSVSKGLVYWSIRWRDQGLGPTASATRRAAAGTLGKAGRSSKGSKRNTRTASVYIGSTKGFPAHWFDIVGPLVDAARAARVFAADNTARSPYDTAANRSLVWGHIALSFDLLAAQGALNAALSEADHAAAQAAVDAAQARIDSKLSHYADIAKANAKRDRDAAIKAAAEASDLGTTAL